MTSPWLCFTLAVTTSLPAVTNRFLANRQMLAALEWANANADTNKVGGPHYQVNHEWGDGTDNGKHAGAISPTSCVGSGPATVPSPNNLSFTPADTFPYFP